MYAQDVRIGSTSAKYSCFSQGVFGYLGKLGKEIFWPFMQGKMAGRQWRIKGASSVNSLPESNCCCSQMSIGAIWISSKTIFHYIYLCTTTSLVPRSPVKPLTAMLCKDCKEERLFHWAQRQTMQLATQSSSIDFL